MLIIYSLLFGVALAQRPSNVSICDYYAEVKYGSATEANQFSLMQSIIALAFGGPPSIASKDTPAGLTGIFNPGVQGSTPVDLLPFFNGSRSSTNLNNQPVGINWLDDGGIVPLADYLSGKTTSVVLTNSSNEYRLFGHFFTAFAHIFGCSQPPPSPPSSGGPLNVAYVHKFMSLNFTELGYFINQLTLSAQYFGFSDTDAQSLNTLMNSEYNVRCAPAITYNPQQGPQLLSLCQDPSCPLAVPNSDCDAYVNLTASGAASSSPSGSASSGPAPGPSSTTSTTPSFTSSTPPAATSESTAPSSGGSSSNALGAGGIAGVAIGGVAVIAFIIAAIFYFRRKRTTENPHPETQQQRWTGSESFMGSQGHGYLSPQSEQFNAYSPNSHNSYLSQAQTSYGPAELVSPKFPPGPPAELSGENVEDGNRMSQAM